MSRSYKKNPIAKDRNPWAKKQANKKVRRYKKPIHDGKQYKKIYQSYDICDINVRMESEKKFLWYDSYFEWYKIFKMK